MSQSFSDYQTIVRLTKICSLMISGHHWKSTVLLADSNARVGSRESDGNSRRKQHKHNNDVMEGRWCGNVS